MDSPATFQDVADRWRPLTADETAKVTLLLADAWALIKLRIPGIEARLAALPPTLDVNLVIMVQAAMVMRMMRNPDGYRQEQIQGYSYTRDDNSASGALFLSADELDLLEASASSSGAYTIRPYYAANFYGAPDPWVTL